MTGKTCKTIIAFSLLISILFTAFLSTSISMTAMEMGVMNSSMNYHSIQEVDDSHSSMPCCEIIGTACSSLVLISPNYVKFTLCGDMSRVSNRNLITQSIFIDILSPPPKA